MYNNVPVCADSCRKKRSTANRGSLSEERYDLLVAAVRGNPDQIPEVDDFIKQNTSYIYSGIVAKANLIFAMKRLELYIGLLVKGGRK